MLRDEELSYRIRGCVYEVYRTLGHGFLEKVYENALLKEFTLQGLNAQPQVPINVSYKEQLVGQYFADIVVERKVVLELKAQSMLSPMHEAQLLNYMRAGGLKLGMLVNFTYPKAMIKRLVV